MPSLRSALPRPPAPPGTIAIGLAAIAATAVLATLALAGPLPRASAHDEASATTEAPTTTEALPGRLTLSERQLEAMAENETGSISGGPVMADEAPPADEGPLAGAVAETRDRPDNECPVMTDSIRRLYLGFLGREPTVAELQRDTDRYQAGEANLEELAFVLANSGLFRTGAGGPLDNAGFVELVYANTLDREPSDDDTDFWVAALADGYPRGNVMLAFTESAEFVRRTGTARPLSGFLAWYPRGVQWYCGVGARNDLAINELVGQLLYADHYFTNHGATDTPIGLSTLRDGRKVVDVLDASLPAGFSDFRWDGQFSGAEHYGDAIDIEASRQTSWVVVFYPSRIGRQRLGWHTPG